MRLRGALIHSETFADRLDVVDHLITAGAPRGGDAARLRKAASSLDAASARFADARIGVAYSAFADLVRIAALFVEWRRGVLNAESDPDRFKRGALERLSLWRSEYSARLEAADFSALVAEVGDSILIADVGTFCQRLAAAPLPVGLYGDQQRGRVADRGADRDRERADPAELTVAFVSFEVDGGPADQVHFLTPYETHDLEIEVRVSRWPEGINQLRLSPVTIEAASAYDFPQFVLFKPAADPPYVIRERGRATIKAAQALRAQPFEFRYAAEFWPKETEQPVSVVGHRTLRIESIDVRRSTLTGYQGMDQRLFDLRNQIRQLPAIPQKDLEGAMILAVPLAGIAARAIQDSKFKAGISEGEFQTYVRDELRRLPQIASELDEHPHAGGGETDLSFRSLRLELKVEPDQRLELTDCQRFVEQAASYTVGSGKRLGLLCVLDASQKDQAPFPAEDGVGLLEAKSGVTVITILIQAGLQKPSALSRKRPASRRPD